jgi:mannose-6-phosphate isomerase-like protein (cupin superfamily)
MHSQKTISRAAKPGADCGGSGSVRVARRSAQRFERGPAGTLAEVGYTLKNLRDTADSAPRFGFGELGEAHFPARELGAQKTGLAYHVLKPDKRQGFGHKHDDAEEIYVVLSGSGRVRLDDEIVELRALDALRVDPPTARAFEAGPDGLAVLVFGPHVEGDGELLQEFWQG